MKKSLIIIVSLIVVVGVMGGGVWYWQKNKVVNQVVTTNQQVVSTNQGASQNSTSTLLTYKNSKYGYEFQYPKSWDNIVESGDYSSVLLFNSANEASLYEKTGGTPDFTSGNQNYAIIDIGLMYKKGATIGWNNVVLNEGIDLKQFLLTTMLRDLARLKPMTFGGVDAFQYSYVKNGFDIGTIWAKLGDNIFGVDTQIGTEYKNYQDLGSAFNTVVSTFKFTK